MQIGVFELEEILNNITDALIVVDCDSRIVLINTAAQKMINGGEEAIGKDISLIIPNTRLPKIIQTETEEINQLQQLSDKTIITNRLLLRDNMGKVVGAIAHFRDVSEVKGLKEQINTLQDIKTLLNAIIESTQDAISVVDENGMGMLINSAYTRITGLTEADVINKLATVDIVEGDSVHLKVLKTGVPMRGVSMKVGYQRKEVLVNGSPIIVQGKLRGCVSVLQDVSELQKLTEELEKAKRRIRHLESKYTFSDIIGESEVILNTIAKAKRAAQTPATILLRGESGTGKELFAHAIHHASIRANKPFIRVNCAALTESILESELFGYVEGAFTGAKKGGRLGLFEEANKGTLFLDEIGDISTGLQIRLLRALQEKEIVKVGDSQPVRVDVRVITATNVDLEEKVKEGKYREDLYYRLNVFPIYIPSLRERSEDIKILVQHLICKLNQEFGCNVEIIDEAALDALQNYHWPGNIRELENVIGRALINMHKGEYIIKEHHLSQSDTRIKHYPISPKTEQKSHLLKTFQETYSQWEKDLLTKTLEITEGNKTKAAKLLNISIRNLYYKMEKHGI